MDFGPIGKFFTRPQGSLRVDEAVRQAEGLPRPVPAPAQMTPEQRADWQAVGLGQMKLGEFRAKHGFIPAPTDNRGLFSR